MLGFSGPLVTSFPAKETDAVNSTCTRLSEINLETSSEDINNNLSVIQQKVRGSLPATVASDS